MIFSLSFHLQLVGVATIILGAVNFGWPRLLGWSADLAAARPLTRQMIHSQTYYIGLTCVILGFAPLVLTAELLTPSRLSTAILAAETLFWGMRWLTQFVVFPPRIWRTSRLYTAGFIGFTLFWTWIVTVFAVALLRSLGIWSA
ncbi:hypothetical protein GCM10009765_79560 [Fodinicola feengrottensis]|uniref:Uncharacterized protein n=1 Tax=Fodinicola feengrottensis TaxID=435914 RepID=A0ABN2J700_9ACTN